MDSMASNTDTTKQAKKKQKQNSPLADDRSCKQFAEIAEFLWWCEISEDEDGKKYIKQNYSCRQYKWNMFHFYAQITDVNTMCTAHWCSLPFSSSRSWPGCPQCSSVSPPRWRPGRSGTSPGREHRGGHSWGQRMPTKHDSTQTGLDYSVREPTNF